MTRRELLELSAALLAAALLAACGRKGPLTPPDQIDPDDDDEYILWPEDANPNPDDDSNDAPWPMEVDPDINTEIEP